MVLEALFWLAVVGVATPYLLYPVTVICLSNLWPWRARSTPEPDELHSLTPSVTLVISAFNEAAVLEEKLRNALALDYPSELLQIMVISDGSDDATDEIATGFAPRVILRRQEPRAGKTCGLTRFVPEASGTILVFSDANAIYETQALRHLVKHFADESVGYVVGFQRYWQDSDSEVSVAERLYWRYEVTLKRAETRVGSVVGADGAIYATRADLFKPLADDDLSDFVNPLHTILAGYRGVFESEAQCFEKVATTFHAEFRRKVRIVNRAFRAVLNNRAALYPSRVGLFAFELFFHKVLRWLVPYLMIACFLLNLVLIGNGALYVATLAGQTLFYGLALLRWVPGLGKFKPVYLAYYFCLANFAALLGTWSALRGRRITTWQPERG